MTISGVQDSSALDKYSYLESLRQAQSTQSTQDMFLNLLVTQMTNQNPLEPMDNDSFIQQMAQFANVEQIEQLNAKISQLVTMEEIVAGQNAFTQAASLVGKTIEYLDAEGNKHTGLVDSVRLDGDGLMVNIGDIQVPMNMVTGILNVPPDGSGSGTTGGTGEQSSDPEAENAAAEEAGEEFE